MAYGEAEGGGGFERQADQAEYVTPLHFSAFYFEKGLFRWETPDLQ